MSGIEGYGESTGATPCHTARSKETIEETPMKTARPETLGLSTERLKRIDAYFDAKYVQTGKLPFAMTLVARKGEVAHHGFTGLIDEARGKKVEADSLFRIYSMTKPLTSALFMMLVEEGKVALDQPVHTLIPSWKNLGVYAGGWDAMQTRPCARPMQMVDLLRHTSGLTYGFQQRTNIDAAYRKLKIGDFETEGDLAHMMEVLSKIPLEFSPGEAWNYSVSTDVLGYLIGVIEGKPFEQVMKERLIDPLGMTDTDFQVKDSERHRFAACFAINAKGERVLNDDPEKSPYLKPPVLVSGGGGLVSTAADYLKFCQMMLNGGKANGVRFLSPKTIALMTSNHLPGRVDLPTLSRSLFSEVAFDGVGFGLGFSVTMDSAKTLLPGTAGEYAWGGAASTAFFIDPKEELIVIFMTQLIPSNFYSIRRELRTLVYSAITESFA
jgi:CubicO group peptidase (beta-lactamase class C family)